MKWVERKVKRDRGEAMRDSIEVGGGGWRWFGRRLLVRVRLCQGLAVEKEGKTLERREGFEKQSGRTNRH